jgi:hypothetical protein
MWWAGVGWRDGGFEVAVVDVYRADPPASARPPLGSPPTTDLARWGVRDPGTLHRLTLSTGTLAGRVEDFLAHIADTADVVRELTAAGLCFARGTGTAPEVAITFDDGPDAGGHRDQTVSALPQVLTRLLDRGYAFVTVDRLAR